MSDTFKKLGRSLASDTLLTLEDVGSSLGLPFLSPAILMAHGLLDQDYTGDINIILNKRDFRWMNVLFDYDGEDEIKRLIDAGKRSTWPRLAQIRNATVIARTLDEILEELDLRELGQLPKGVRHITAAT